MKWPWMPGWSASAWAKSLWLESSLAVWNPATSCSVIAAISSYSWVVAVRARGAHFVSRCSRASFAVAQHLFQQDRAGMSVRATLKAPQELRAECRRRGWPLEVDVRFVTVRLSTGELEVLVTSLLDQ